MPSELETKDRFKKLEIEISRLKARLMNIDHRIPIEFGVIEGGGEPEYISGSGILTFATMLQANEAADELIPGQACYVTELNRYFHLLYLSGLHVWRAWSFLE